ncbi:hypothetical protein L596_024213 [Steinernema carpocapsae]|uniref:Uncharacterized protein n=1 Tax=Steinernema carpocapsae TaxID=34508 RepID=A0A4U5MG32_STECR|nr:hypothetical protein L596_024213 [Steinernema carpocapsae]
MSTASTTITSTNLSISTQTTVHLRLITIASTKGATTPPTSRLSGPGSPRRRRPRAAWSPTCSCTRPPFVVSGPRSPPRLPSPNLTYSPLLVITLSFCI